MDTIGVGSLVVVVLVGLFSGVVMALQMSRALAQYGKWKRPVPWWRSRWRASWARC